MKGLVESILNGTLEKRFDDIQNVTASSDSKEVFLLTNSSTFDPEIPTIVPSISPVLSMTEEPTSLPSAPIPVTPATCTGGDRCTVALSIVGTSIGLIAFLCGGAFFLVLLTLRKTVVIVDFKTRMDDDLYKDMDWNEYAEVHKKNIDSFLRKYYNGKEIKAKRIASAARSSASDQTHGEDATDQAASTGGVQQVAFRLLAGIDGEAISINEKEFAKEFAKGLLERYGKKHGLTKLEPRLTWKGSAKAFYELPGLVLEELFADFRDSKRHDSRTFHSGGLTIYVDTLAPAFQAEGRRVQQKNDSFKEQDGIKGKDVLLFKDVGEDGEDVVVDLLIPNTSNGGSRLGVVPYFRQVTEASSAGTSCFASLFGKSEGPAELEEPSLYEIIGESIVLVKKSETAIIKKYEDRGYHRVHLSGGANGPSSTFIRMELSAL